MNTAEKIKRSWWIILSFIFGLNGFGFVYIGLKQNNKNWVIEGIAYEIPWIFFIIFWSNKVVSDKIFIICLVVMLLSIIRSIWVAIKLADVYDNEEKYSVRPTIVKNEKAKQADDKFSPQMTCCGCVFLIFIIAVMISIL